MLHQLLHLDRRWIFAGMAAAVAVPMCLGLHFPEEPSGKVRAVYQAIEDLAPGSLVVMSLDYDPASEGELSPMSAALTRHCCEKQLKIVYLSLWDRAPVLIRKMLDLIEVEYPKLKYGRDYVNLGFKPGGEVVIKNSTERLRADFPADYLGQPLDQLLLTRDIKNIRDAHLLIVIGSGSPGPKEWVQFGASPHKLRMVAGVTGVQAPQLQQYIPAPLLGTIAGIKGAAEYEQALLTARPHLRTVDRAREGLRRMGPQLVSHLYIILLIVVGNVLSFAQRRSRAA